MSSLLDFYRGEKPDIEGRLIQDIWAWPDDELEFVHNYIQWLFPLPEPSQFNPDAPLLTASDMTAFKADPVLQGNLQKSFARILRFLGLQQDTPGKIQEGDNFQDRQADVWSGPNHNWLRITRILRSLTLLGQADQARALYNFLSTVYKIKQFPISKTTFQFWTDALKPELLP